MTPKEKAKELISKYAIKLPTKYNNIVDEVKIWDYNISLAKQCALIAVDEIIKSLRKDLPEIGLGKGYWYSVKQEIDNL